MAETYITDTQFAARTNTHRTWPWRRAKLDPDFPQPVRLTPGCTRWKLSDIEAWEAEKTRSKSKR